MIVILCLLGFLFAYAPRGKRNNHMSSNPPFAHDNYIASGKFSVKPHKKHIFQEMKAICSDMALVVEAPESRPGSEVMVTGGQPLP